MVIHYTTWRESKVPSIHGHHPQQVCSTSTTSCLSSRLQHWAVPWQRLQPGRGIPLIIDTSMRTRIYHRDGDRVQGLGESQHDMGYILYWNYLKQIGKILVHRLYCTGKQIYAVLVNRICWDICPKWLSLDVSLIKTKKFLY